MFVSKLTKELITNLQWNHVVESTSIKQVFIFIFSKQQKILAQSAGRVRAGPVPEDKYLCYSEFSSRSIIRSILFVFHVITWRTHSLLFCRLKLVNGWWTPTFNTCRFLKSVSLQPWGQQTHQHRQDEREHTWNVCIDVFLHRRSCVHTSINKYSQFSFENTFIKVRGFLWHMSNFWPCKCIEKRGETEGGDRSEVKDTDSFNQSQILGARRENDGFLFKAETLWTAPSSKDRKHTHTPSRTDQDSGWWCMKSGPQPTPLQSCWANVKLLLTCCFTERAQWDTRHPAGRCSTSHSL